MVTLSVILLLVGVVAIVLELLMPGFDGFVSGIIGVLALIASAVLAVIFVDWGWIIVGINIAVLATCVGLFIAFIRRKQFHGRIILSEALAEDLPQIDVNSLVGKIGKTMTLLRPYGEVDFNGVRVEVSSDGSLVERGMSVKVQEVKNGKVIVSVVDGN